MDTNATIALPTAGAASIGVAGADLPPCLLEQDADTRLMLRFQAGEDGCFDELVARYRRPLLGFAFRLVHNAAASEELLQEAFLRVYLHRQRYRPEARFSTWMYRILQRLALNYLRDHRYEQRQSSLDEDAEAPLPSAVLLATTDVRPNPEQALLAASHAQERQRIIRAAIAALPERQRTAVLLHKYQGLDYDDIGGVLQLSSSATKSLLFRAYQSLRRDLKDLL